MNNTVHRQITVKVPTTADGKPTGKFVTLTRDGDEVKIQLPASFKPPKVTVEDLKRGLGELTRDDDG